MSSTIKIIIAGPRDFNNQSFIFSALDMVFSRLIKSPKENNNTLEINDLGNIEFVEGGATGIDSLAKSYAISKNIKYKEFPADWNKHGRAAGPIRNKQMAEYSDILIAFRYVDNPSRGTENMIRQAKENNLKIIMVNIRPTIPKNKEIKKKKAG
jgi:hypothetical protein